VLKYIHNRLALLLGLVLAAAAAQAGSSTLKLGDKAPDFSLPNGDGKTVTLSEYLGRGPVVLVFYRGFW
jgi:peroxiredoxin